MWFLDENGCLKVLDVIVVLNVSGIDFFVKGKISCDSVVVGEG